MKGKKSVLLARMMEALTPINCYGCGLPDVVFCTTCRDDVRYGVQQCFGCGRDSVGGKTCEHCAQTAALSGVAVAAHYGGAVRTAILAMKFKRLQTVAREMAGWLTEIAPQTDLITCVPIAPARYRERGYNQSELMARAFAQKQELPFTPLLWRDSAVHQLGAGRQERLERIRGQFEATRQLDGQRVLIVDDVVTTGATLDECARVLLEAGASEVWGAAIARH